MEAESLPQNVPNSGKKKRKKRKKKSKQDEPTHGSNLDAADASSLPSKSGPFLMNKGENSVTGTETNTSSDIPVNEVPKPVVKHLEDDIKRSDDLVSKVKVAMSASVVGNVSTMLEEKSPEKKSFVEKEEIIKNPICSLPASSEIKSSSSPSSGRKKKKKKANGFFISDVNLSDKARNGAEAVEIERNDLRRFTADDLLLQKETRERNNFNKIAELMCKIGLQTLRKLFMDFHPNWTNMPDDAKKLDKGKMKLKHHEQALFNTGDINSWDISLLTTVLLYTKKSYKKLSKKKGFEDALRTVKDQKNRLISHRNSEKMTDDEFQQAWSIVSKSLVTIGADSKEIDDIFTDDILQNGKFYRDMFLQELAASGAVQAKVHSMHSEMKEMHSTLQDMSSKVDSLVANKSSAKDNPPPNLQELTGPAFDEWLRFCDKVHHFDERKSNYILITDEMSSENLKHFSVLRTVPWKIVLDFDPSSEESGMYHDFSSNESKSSLIEMITPDEMRRHHASTINFARHFDTHNTQWMFVNGREKDNSVSGGPQSLKEWKASSLKHISRFLTCASDPEKLDKHKPVVCVILPFHKETIPRLQLTLERLKENFDEFPLTFVGVKQGSILEDLQEDFEIHITNLSPYDLSAGLSSLLQVTDGKEYRMPTFQAKLPVKLSNNQYLYLQKYLEVMYDGCEDLPTFDDEEEEEKLNKIFSEHRESFLSGNWISFVSLYDNHDAERELGKEVRDYIQRHLDQEPRHSSIIEIRHAPGTGGTTIARRVLWNLHNSFPCAIARLEDYKFDIDDDFQFINNLADRIAALQEHCQTIPLILLDGNHSRIEGLNNKLVRLLNARGQRAVLLSCLHLSTKPTSGKDEDNSDVQKRFEVNVKLEMSKSDLRQFEEKYRDYIDKFKASDALSPRRVFHFPLLAMLKGLEGFESKLKNIVHKSFDGMDGLRKEIAAVVAFIQIYASQETPGSFICKAFKKHVRQDNAGIGITYEDINQLITDQLLSLMVPARPTKRQPKTNSSASATTEKYTLQHPLVAEMVLQGYYEKMKYDVFSLTRAFLELPIFQDSEFFSLVNALFIRNRSSDPKARFSILFEELKSRRPRESAKLFSELAKKTGDAIMFAHAARFHAKMNPPIFATAKELIVEALKCKNAQSRSRIIYDFKGQILQSELKFMVETQKIHSISVLEKLANEAIQSYKKARNWPVTYPVPLMGEVKVWISCIEWIIKQECGGDADKAFEFITSATQEGGAPPFFHTCIGDSFHLLDIIDGIVQTEPNLAEPMDIQKQANNLRLSLLKTFNKNKGRKQFRRENDQDLIRACEALCSIDKFPKSSPVELKRLQVHFVLNSGDVETATKEIVDFVLKLLEDLVFNDKQSARVGMARHLMRVCVLVTGPKQYSLDKGLSVAELWMKESGYDPIPYFYKMMVAFLMILDGNQVFYRDIYIKALEKCKEKSQDHYRRFVSTHFLKNTGEGMNRLMTKGALLTGEKEYLQNIGNFWTNQSRKKLRECSGRIRLRSMSGKKKQAYIELVEGNIELYVSKNADIGNVEQDYAPGTLVYFVVSFSLRGPVANGITFEPKSNQTQSSSK